LRFLRIASDLLESAQEGYEAEKKRIDAQIAEINQRLNDGRTEPVAPTETDKPRKNGAPPLDERWLLRNGLDTPS